MTMFRFITLGFFATTLWKYKFVFAVKSNSQNTYTKTLQIKCDKDISVQRKRITVFTYTPLEPN